MGFKPLPASSSICVRILPAATSGVFTELGCDTLIAGVEPPDIKPSLSPASSDETATGTPGETGATNVSALGFIVIWTLRGTPLPASPGIPGPRSISSRSPISLVACSITLLKLSCETTTTWSTSLSPTRLPYGKRSPLPIDCITKGNSFAARRGTIV